MEEDLGVKAAPVTRLRRRISVETEDTKSPSAPSTPTKKRSARLAAKPQLELIDEHAVTDSPKRTTRKSISRDITEPEEKAMTPARRSARTKSNTSLVSEADEKPLTPARRSTRIKSNTSILSEATQSVESPRAKRAVARRNSQVGSDTELTLTPAKTRRTRKASTSSIDKEETPSISETAVTPGRTRRTRKGSTSSIDNPAEAVQADKPSLITEVITEEPEGKLRKSTSNDTDNIDSKDDSPTRKSPRLLAKKSRKGKSEDTNEENYEQSNDLPTSTEELDKDVNASTETVSRNDISVSSTNLIKGLDIEYRADSKNRHRTKSWTTLCAASPVESIFYSDNENTKKKLKKHGKIFDDKRLSVVENAGSGDGPKQITAEQKNDKDKEVSFHTSEKKRKNRNSSITNESGNLENSEVDATKEVDISNESNKENLGEVSLSKDLSAAELLFENPNADVKSMVIIEDSDSNTGSMGKQDKQIDGEDQCVPVVLHQSEDLVNIPEKQAGTDGSDIFDLRQVDSKVTNDNTVEPMDIDETMPDNVSLTIFNNEGKTTSKLSKSFSQEIENDSKDINQSKNQIKETCKSPFNKTQEPNNNVKESPNKSKRKSSLSHSTSNKKEDLNISVGTQNVLINESISGKKTRKSSLIIPQDSDYSFNQSKSKKKYTTPNTYPQDLDNGNESDGVVTSSEEVGNNEIIQSKTSRKSSLSMAQDADDYCKESNKSKRKSLSISIAHEKTENGSKSTLVLSQIKDTSAVDNDVSSQKAKEMSKSINIEESNKDALKNKNLALNYLTSTPVQDKNIEKLTMQMNTSVITPMKENKKEIKTSKSTPKKDDSTISKTLLNDSDDEDTEESDESSQEKSDMFDNEAQDAGEDYESGDSQDEDEREYERENKIMEKGETLTSEDDMSDDSDYEKDSFIVSSDAEDNELLSGSGDDLDMSDNELTLSTTSKNKYNKRKLKEQKNASREMFEARHGINKDEKDLKSKKSNRSRLDSTLLKSDEDIMPPKKNKRMRLESTNQTKSDSEDIKSENEEIGYKKKRSKRLSESVCNESVINEKEVTICNLSTTEKEDPLSLQIKTEPKTPLKDLEISRVHLTDQIEEVLIDKDMSVTKLNETSDPLQATMFEKEHSNDNDDSISENEEIAKNYESVLKILNIGSRKQIKTQDISLNLNKKDKRKAKEAIVDELNLTQTKASKKDSSFQAKEKSVKHVFKKLADTHKSSESIDFQLLFSNDSNDSDIGNDGKSNKAIVDELNLTQTKASKKDSSFQAKEKSVKRVFKKLADTHESSESIDFQLLFSNDSNDSDKGNDGKSNKSGVEESFVPLKRTDAKTNIQSGIDKDCTNDERSVLNFFIDTKGNLSDKETNDNESDDAPVEVLYVSNKKKTNTTLTKIPTIEKKKNNASESQEPKDISKKKKLEGQEPSEQISQTKISEKKKNKSISEEDKLDTIKTPTSEKKKKKVHEVSVRDIGNEERDAIEYTVTNSKKRKRKSSVNTTTDDIVFEGDRKELNSSQKLTESVLDNKPLLGNKKKKPKISNSIDEKHINVASMEAKEPEKLQTSMKDFEHHPKMSKKRKERDEEEHEKVSKVFKEHSFDKVHVPRLPPSVIDQLADKPQKEINVIKKTKVISTSNFVVEETKKRKNKPSDFLEETVYLNNDDIGTKVQNKSNLKKPKVLPFLPTVSISDSGFTTNFKVNVISQKMEFVARSNNIPNFKNDYLNNKRIKKLRTYDLYKKQRSAKLSKY